MTTKGIDRAAFWQQHCAAFQASGLSRKSYCSEHGLKLHQLSYQLDRISKLTKDVGKSVFARVVTSDPKPASGRVAARLVFGGGVALELDSGADPSWIAQVIAQVGGAR